MKVESTNIYRQCRHRAGFSLKEAVARLNVGKRSLEYWEAYELETGNGRLPNEDIVIKMAEVYESHDQRNAEYLLLEHHTLNTEIGKILYPNFRTIDLAKAMINYQVERDDSECRERQVMEIIINDQPTELEKKMASAFMKDLSELIVSGLILQAALLKKGFKMEVEEPAKRRDKAYERVTWR